MKKYYVIIDEFGRESKKVKTEVQYSRIKSWVERMSPTDKLLENKGDTSPLDFDIVYYNFYKKEIKGFGAFKHIIYYYKK